MTEGEKKCEGNMKPQMYDDELQKETSQSMFAVDQIDLIKKPVFTGCLFTLHDCESEIFQCIQ